MKTRVCPWYLGYLLANPVRRWLQDPVAIVAPHLREGMKVLEVGPGMGFFTIPMAQAVGPGGRIVSVDVQQKMLNGLGRRARRAGVGDRIDCRLTSGNSLGLSELAGALDFALLFAVVHEVPDQPALLAEVSAALKPGARLLLAEPKGHVSSADFDRTLEWGAAAGLTVVGTPTIWRSRARLLEKKRQAS